MRLFTAIGLPQQIGEKIAGAARRLITTDNKVRWTAVSNMHITLSFLGSVDPVRLDAIHQALASIRAQRLRVTLDGAGAFPRAGVVLIKVQPSPELLALAEQNAAVLEACGFKREARPYQPHVTLARAKGQVTSVPSAVHAPVFHQSFEAEEFRLYQSVTHPEGAQYQVLRAFPLA